MKKCIFALALVLGLAFAQNASAQYYDQALGLRTGTSFEASYKRFVVYLPRVQQAVEGLIGLQVDERTSGQQNGYLFEALYHVHLDLGFDTGFSGFAGGGFYCGAFVEPGQKAFFGGGVTAMIGVEYTFTHVPINLSLDWKPFAGYPRSSIVSGGLTLRYVLPTTWQ